MRLILPVIAVATLGVLSPLATEGQASLSGDENFRREPNGVVLARLTAGAPISVLRVNGDWTEVTLRGWVWLASLEDTDRDGHDLIVSEAGGENLRAERQGQILGRLEEGALLDEVERDENWASIERTGWVWSASISDLPVQPSAPAPTATPTRQERPGFLTTPAGGAAVLTAPDGDTLARAAGDRDLELLARQGNWARVRVEGWIWMPGTAETPEMTTPDDEVSDLEPSDLSGSIDYVGRVVTWPVQFISLERAEAVRTDFFEGEPFLLVRYGGDAGDFVYVPVAPDRLDEVQGLVPLENITITARVRVGASTLTGTPIVDLIALERSPGPE